MNYRIDPRLAKVLGLCVAVVVLGAVVFRQSMGFRLDELGGSPLQIALGVTVLIVVAAIWIFTDSAFES